MSLQIEPTTVRRLTPHQVPHYATNTPADAEPIADRKQRTRPPWQLGLLLALAVSLMLWAVITLAARALVGAL